MNLRLTCSCIFLLLVAASSTAAIAEPPPGTRFLTKVTKTKKGPVRTSRGTEEGVSAVKAPPEMPGVTFPSGKFLYGFKNVVKNGVNMGARFKVNDSPSAVLAYYRSALSGGDWKENSTSHNQYVATNAKLRSTVTVQTYKSSVEGGCEVYFLYGAK